MRLDFSAREDKARWVAVNDGVMGGRSSGGPSFEDGNLIFSGVINTNGGGFSSIRSRVEPGQFENVTGLKMRVKSDGRGYELNLRTNVTYWGRSVAYRASIPATRAGEWAEVRIDFADLEPSVFGRTVRTRAFEAEDTRILGIILADGQDGPFKLAIDWIETVETPQS